MHTSSQASVSLERATMILSRSAMGTLSCFIVSSYLSVTEFSSKVWKSTVTPKGIPISSVLAYLFPMDCPVSSTLQVIRLLLNLCSE